MGQYSFIDKETEAKRFKYLGQVYIASKDLNEMIAKMTCVYIFIILQQEDLKLNILGSLVIPWIFS